LKTNLKYFQTDFVDDSSSDTNKRKIVKKSIEMICIKENAFQEVKEGKDWKIFKGAISIKWDTNKSYIQVYKKNGINLIPVKTNVDF